MFYCKACSKTLWGMGLKTCPACKNKLTETDYFITTWIEVPAEKKEGVIQEILNGNYDRKKEEIAEKAPIEIQTSKNYSSADEIEKFKGLLDKGIITQEEFDAKKKQLLGL